MRRRPPRARRTDTLFPYTAFVRSGKSVHAGRDLFARDSGSVKLSALHSRYEVFHADVAVPTLIARIVELAALAREHGIGLTIDAEESERLEMRSEEHTSELQSLMRISYAVFCLKKKKPINMNQFSEEYCNTPNYYVTRDNGYTRYSC